MSNIGTMTIDFAASVARLEADVKRGADATEAGVKRMSDAAGYARNMFEMLGVTLSAAAFVAYIKNTVDAADALNDMSQQLGLTVRDLSAYKMIADQSGTSLDGLAGGMKKLSVFLTEHSDKLQAAGITATDTNGAFLQLADLFAAMPDGAQKTALAIDVFGKSGADLIPTLNQGGAALRSQLEAGQQLNPVIDELAKRSDQFNDSMAKVRAVSAGTASIIANDLLKVMNLVTDEVGDAKVSTDGFAHSVGTGLAEGMRYAVIVGNGFIQVLKGLGSAYGGLAAAGAALVRGDFAEVGNIFEAMKEDAVDSSAAYAAFVDRMMNGSADAGAAVTSRAASEAQARAQNAAARSARALMGGGDKAGRSPAERQEKVGRYTADEATFQFQMAEDAARWEQIKAEDAAREEQERTRRLASLAQKSADIAQGFLTEQEQEQMFFGSRMATLQAMQEASNSARADDADAQLQSDMYYHDLMEQEKLRHLAKMGDDEAKAALARKNFAALTATQQAQQVAGLLTSSLALASQKYKAFFYIHKLASMAQAYINTAEGVTKALSWGPIGLGIAPVIAAAGAANIAIIAAQKFEGPGGGSPGAVGGGYAAPITGPGGYNPPEAPGAAAQEQIAAPRQQVNLTMIGDGFSYKDVAEKLIPLLNEAIGNGVDIVVNKG